MCCRLSISSTVGKTHSAVLVVDQAVVDQAVVDQAVAV